MLYIIKVLKKTLVLALLSFVSFLVDSVSWCLDDFLLGVRLSPPGFPLYLCSPNRGRDLGLGSGNGIWERDLGTGPGIGNGIKSRSRSRNSFPSPKLVPVPETRSRPQNSFPSPKLVPDLLAKDAASIPNAKGMRTLRANRDIQYAQSP